MQSGEPRQGFVGQGENVVCCSLGFLHGIVTLSLSKGGNTILPCGGYGFFAHRKPKLLFFTSGLKKLRLKVGALSPHPYDRQSNQEPPFSTRLSLPYSDFGMVLPGCGR